MSYTMCLESPTEVTIRLVIDTLTANILVLTFLSVYFCTRVDHFFDTRRRSSFSWNRCRYRRLYVSDSLVNVQSAVTSAH